MLTELLRGYHIEQPWISQMGIPCADLEGKLATDPAFCNGGMTGTPTAAKLPEFLHLLDALPRTPTGKVQKGPLRDIVLKGMASA
jgi:hypothetical protein